ncbi:hypothetical protein KC19_5G142700 [Ceratodon purpureus]|uniref:Uncharacterized protein n=1 Tax=Ceratodon purpureus TaxID=3225 RepID=A0A8T0I3Y6_CERPU|nr:hypothetical protein KC19_5G142700 [Ceratodon purpureus]
MQLNLVSSPSPERVPDIFCFPFVEKLCLTCYSLMRLTFNTSLTAVDGLNLDSCHVPERLRDLRNFDSLKKLSLWRCKGLTELACSTSLAMETCPWFLLHFGNSAGFDQP